MVRPVRHNQASDKQHLRHELGRWAARVVLPLALLGCINPSARATTYQYQGLIDFDYGSSIAGLAKRSRYFVDFVLDGSVLDTDHTVFENDLYNANGVRGLTTIGSFAKPFVSLRLTLDPTSVGTLDLSALNFNLADPNSNYSRVVDANQPPNPQGPPCIDYLCVGEHITLRARDLTPDAPVTGLWFNLYNSNFYEPVYASRQLLLDTSASGDPFSFADLFLHGPETLAEFQSYRPPNIVEFQDPVLLTGPNGTVASGRFLRLVFVPPAPTPLPLVGVGAALGWSRRLRCRTKAQTQAPRQKW